MDSEQEQPTSQQHASTPGAALAAAREAMGLSVEQVAEQLKLAPRQVSAIEHADYGALPNMAVTRGFIRAYAKVVRMDPAPLVAMVEVEGAEGHATATVRPTKVTAAFNESRFPSLTERNNGKPMGAVIAGVGLVALLGLAGAWQAGLLTPAALGVRGAAAPAADAPAPAPVAAETAPAVPLIVTQQPGAPAPSESLQQPSVPLISVPPPAGAQPAAAPAMQGAQPGAVPAGAMPSGAPQAGQGAAAAAPGATQALVPGGAAAKPGAPQAGQGAAAAVPATTQAAVPGGVAAKPAATVPGAVAPGAAPQAAPAPQAAAPAAPAGGKLVLTVKQDSWIEIRRPGQSALISRLVRAGSTESFDVREKDLLIVGKPGGVSATLGGAALALPPVEGGTISRVNIK